MGARPDCRACPYSVDGKPPHKPVLCEGNGDTAVGAVIGEGPSFEDVDQHRPFSGQGGRGLDDELTSASLPRAHLLVVLATACRAPPGTKNVERRAAARACAPLFEGFVGAARRRKIPALVLGSLASKSWSGKELTVDDKRGFVRELENGAKWILTWPPQWALFRAPYEAGNFANDVGRFGRMVRKKLERAPKVTIDVRLADIKRIASSPEPVAVDVETAPETPSEPWTGKDPRRALLRTIGLGTTGEGLSIEWFRLAKEERLLRAIAALLADTRHMKLGHNYRWYDERVLNRYGLNTLNFRDTRDLRRAVSSVSRLSLRYLTSIYTDFPPWKESDEEDGEKVIFTDKMEDLKTYNALDCVATARVYRGVLRDLASEREAG